MKKARYFLVMKVNGGGVPFLVEGASIKAVERRLGLRYLVQPYIPIEKENISSH